MLVYLKKLYMQLIREKLCSDMYHRRQLRTFIHEIFFFFCIKFNLKCKINLAIETRETSENGMRGLKQYNLTI